MNFVRSSLSIARLLGQRSRLVTETWSHRGMCNKPQEVKTEPLPSVPAEAARQAFKIPGSKPSEMDKRFLIWSGRFKTKDQIPDLVSYEMIDAARNRIRVKVCYLMIVASIFACMVSVILGKRAAGRQESITALNMERRAQWREELKKSQAAESSEKAH